MAIDYDIGSLLDIHLLTVRVLQMHAGVMVIDGNRIRFRVDDWRSMLALKYLRLRIREIMTQAFRNPGRQLSDQQQIWFDIWQRAFAHRAAYEKRIVQ